MCDIVVPVCTQAVLRIRTDFEPGQDPTSENRPDLPSKVYRYQLIFSSVFYFNTKNMLPVQIIVDSKQCVWCDLGRNFDIRLKGKQNL